MDGERESKESMLLVHFNPDNAIISILRNYNNQSEHKWRPLPTIKIILELEIILLLKHFNVNALIKISQ